MKKVLTISLLALALPLAVTAQTGARPGSKTPPAAAQPAPTEATPTPGSTITTLPTLHSKPAVSTPSLAVAARAVLITGVVTIGQGEGAQRLSAGDPIYEQQTLYVGPNSYANLKFEDGGRVLLRPDTQFAIESYRYVPPPPASAPMGAAPAATPVPAPQGAQGTAFFRLVRGGFRAISGLIGKADHQQYRVTTPVATIGIRGTDYEAQICTDDCPAQAQAFTGMSREVAATELAGLDLAQAGDSGRGGVIAATHEGSISLHTSRGEFVVDAGKVAVALWNGQTFMLPVVPDALLRNPLPSPDKCQ